MVLSRRQRCRLLLLYGLLSCTNLNDWIFSFILMAGNFQNTIITPPKYKMNHHKNTQQTTTKMLSTIVYIRKLVYLCKGYIVQ